MLRDITLGQYYQAESVIHRLDPRVKLAATMLFIISLFVFHGATGYLVAAAFLAVVIKLSKVPFRYMVKGMKAILFLLLITVVFNLFLTPGDPLFFDLEAYYYKTRCSYSCFFGNSFKFFNNRLLHYDIDNNAKSVDGRFRTDAETVKSS